MTQFLARGPSASLMAQQSIVGLIVQPLHQTHKHVGNVIKRLADFCKHESCRQSEALGFRQVVHRGDIERTCLSGKLFNLDVGNALKCIGPDRLLSQPGKMFKELSIVLRGWLFRFLLQSVPWTLFCRYSTVRFRRAKMR
jgi:hypothetical protein